MKHEEVVQMRFISNLIQKYKRATPKQLVLTGVFMLAFAGAIGAGLASQQSSFASASYNPDCGSNSVMKCGAANPQEFINKLKNGDGAHSDLKAVYANVPGGNSLQSSDYASFASTAKYGILNYDGKVTVDGKTVATNAMTMGRHNYTYNGQAVKSVTINGVKYYYGTPHQRWNSMREAAVMVFFDENGVVKTVVMYDCGNPVIVTPRKPAAVCDALVRLAVKGEKDTYEFSTQAHVDSYGLAKLTQFNYFYQYAGGSATKFATTSNMASTAKITLSKTATIWVTVKASLPGGKTKSNITSSKCKTVIEVKKPFYACDAIITNTSDNKTFRFSAKPKMSTGVTVASAEFKLDNSSPVTVIGDEDQNGYKQYTVTVGVGTHTVKVTRMTFKVDGKNVVVATPDGKCQTKVTRDKPPVCEYNPNLPPNHPDCKPPVEECVPEGKEDANCELPNTGPAGVAGLFAGVSAFGAAAHRFAMNRRNRR